MRSFWMTAHVLLCFSLAACGGGSGGDGSDGGSGGANGGGSGGGSAPTADGAFTLSGNSASLTAIQRGAVPRYSSLSLTITGRNVSYVGAAYANGQVRPNWIDINITGSGYVRSLRAAMDHRRPIQ